MFYNYKTNHSLIKNNLIKRIMLAALTIIFMSMSSIPAQAECIEDYLAINYSTDTLDLWDGGSVVLLWADYNDGNCKLEINLPNATNIPDTVFNEGDSIKYIVNDYEYTVSVTQIVYFSSSNVTAAEVEVCRNERPATPTLEGPTSGVPLTTYSYTATVSDPDGDKIQYAFNLNISHIYSWFYDVYESY